MHVLASSITGRGESLGRLRTSGGPLSLSRQEAAPRGEMEGPTADGTRFASRLKHRLWAICFRAYECHCANCPESR